MTNSNNGITWRNHYVPQFILKNFLDYSVDSNGKINICDKTLDENQKIEKRNTDTTGYLQHLYTVEDKNGKPTDLIEKYLGSIEDPTSKIVQKIINNNNILINDNRVFRPLNILSYELETLIKFLAFQAIRTPKSFTLAGEIMHAFEHIINEFDNKTPNLNPPLKTYYNDELVSMTLNIDTINEFNNLFRSYYFALVVNPHSNFFIGDSGICSKYVFSKKKNEIYLPLTPRISLIGLNYTFYDDMEVNDMFVQSNNDAKIIEETLLNINICSIKDAKQFIFSHKTYTHELLKEICSFKSPKLHISTGNGVIIPEVKHINRWNKNKF